MKRLMSGKWSKYMKHYNPKWEEEPVLKDWIAPSKQADIMKRKPEAFCKFCNVHIRAHHSDLIIHSKREKHKYNALKFQRNRKSEKENYVEFKLNVGGGDPLLVEVPKLDAAKQDRSCTDVEWLEDEQPSTPADIKEERQTPTRAAAATGKVKEAKGKSSATFNLRKLNDNELQETVFLRQLHYMRREDERQQALYDAKMEVIALEKRLLIQKLNAYQIEIEEVNDDEFLTTQ